MFPCGNVQDALAAVSVLPAGSRNDQADRMLTTVRQTIEEIEDSLAHLRAAERLFDESGTFVGDDRASHGNGKSVENSDSKGSDVDRSGIRSSGSPASSAKQPLHHVTTVQQPQAGGSVGEASLENAASSGRGTDPWRASRGVLDTRQSVAYVLGMKGRKST